MDLLFQMVYTSTATALLERRELMDLLQKSIHRNTKAGITGLLLYKEGSFMQVLEGEEKAVKALFSKISHDPRHRNIITLIQETIQKREFPEAAMAFRDLQTGEKPPGYSDFLNTPLNGDEYAKDSSKTKKLLLIFK